jgi:hypothetical protein
VNSIRTTAEKPKNSGINVQTKLESVKSLKNQPVRDGNENERRATEMGPVLEEILRSHWEHWGLND